MFNIYIIKSLTTEQDLIDMFKEYNNIFLIEDTIIICKTYLQIIDAYQNHYELFKQHANTCFKFAKPLIHWFTFPNALHKIINVAEWVLNNLKQHQNFDNNFRHQLLSENINVSLLPTDILVWPIDLNNLNSVECFSKNNPNSDSPLIEFPEWVTNVHLINSHKANLCRKFPKLYTKWSDEINLFKIKYFDFDYYCPIDNGLNKLDKSKLPAYCNYSKKEVDNFFKINDKALKENTECLINPKTNRTIKPIGSVYSLYLDARLYYEQNIVILSPLYYLTHSPELENYFDGSKITELNILKILSEKIDVKLQMLTLNVINNKNIEHRQKKQKKEHKLLLSDIIEFGNVDSSSCFNSDDDEYFSDTDSTASTVVSKKIIRRSARLASKNKKLTNDVFYELDKKMKNTKTKKTNISSFVEEIPNNNTIETNKININVNQHTDVNFEMMIGDMMKMSLNISSVPK